MNDDDIEWIRTEINKELKKLQDDTESMRKTDISHYGAGNISVLATEINYNEGKIRAYSDCLSLLRVCEHVNEINRKRMENNQNQP